MERNGVRPAGSDTAMRTELFDFDLPDDRIALEPVSPRDAARLLVVHPGANNAKSSRQQATQLAPGVPPSDEYLRLSAHDLSLEDRVVRDLPYLVRPGDVLVFNDTRVIRAALEGERTRAGHRALISFNLHRRVDESRWRAFARPAKRLALGDRIRFGHEGRVCLLGTLEATVTAIGEAGEVELSFSLHSAYLDKAIAILGDPPLPPYILGKRRVRSEDAEDYQTVYARREGAVAAPTAGLHFTDGLLSALDARGILRLFATLHVGAGTFLPVKVEDTDHHVMHAEWGEITSRAAQEINETHAAGGRVVAVGTTTLRLLESAAGADGVLCPFTGDTRLFITPGYRFRIVD